MLTTTTTSTTTVIIMKHLTSVLHLLIILFLLLLPTKAHDPHRAPIKYTTLEKLSPCSRQRTITGQCTHPIMKWWGQAGRPLAGWYNRFSRTPIGNDRPSPREISNILFKQHTHRPSRRRISEFANCYGQFIDHVFVHVPVDKTDPMDIPIPTEDEIYNNATRQSLKFFRSKRIIHKTFKNLIPNELSSYIDASNLYGNTEERARQLRTMKDGLLLTYNNQLNNSFPPKNFRKILNSPNKNLTQLYLAGDLRANEQPNLLVLHIIWLREHNTIALHLKQLFPNWNDEQIYQAARSIVIAEMQKITYDEMLPAFLGEQGNFEKNPLTKYNGWKWWIKSELTNFFTTCSFRLGHSMVNNNLTLISERNMKQMDIKEHFWNPKIVENLGIDPFLRGMTQTVSQEADTQMVPSLRNFLFDHIPQANGFDLAAMNIQRARDHGIPDYNTMRRYHGLKPKKNFNEITKNKKLAKNLEKIYNGDINNIDPWVGGLIEDKANEDCSMGELFKMSWIHEFKKLRDGDRLWYQQFDRIFDKQLQKKSMFVKNIINNQLTMKDIVLRNSNILPHEIQDNLFIVS